ncbi:MAG: prolipoprotein diacylglyceryl transferase family protein, partial [Patescibacteria group bacterium]|nr:prolipoprotein diacylglyceryl transferase family protein [Patescibacteria group bacterium]
MHPELFSFHLFGNNIIITSYSFFYTLAVLFVIVGSYMSVIRHDFSHKKALCMLFFVALAGFVGARLLHVVLNPSLYMSGQLHVLSLHMSGFTIVGGLIAAIIAGIIVGKMCGINVWRFGDIVVPYLGFGIAIARMGCFLNGCCFGHITSLPWGIKFPLLSYAHQYQITHGVGNIFAVARVHPTQIYEMLAVIIGSVFAIVINRKNIFPGAAILFFGMWFSAFRLMNMFFRQMPDSLILSQNKYIVVYFGIFVMCLIIFIYQLKRQKIKNV